MLKEVRKGEHIFASLTRTLRGKVQICSKKISSFLHGYNFKSLQLPFFELRAFFVYNTACLIELRYMKHY